MSQLPSSPAPELQSDRFAPRRRSAPMRVHGLDWLRALAALLVVMLHAGIAYTLTPLPGLAWPVHDPRPSAAVHALTWWIDGFIMPLFFLMGGFAAAQLLAQRGPWAFLKHRTRRLLVPLLFGCVVILPLDLYAWLLGWVVEGRIPPGKLRSLKFDAGVDEGLWGVSHLWFLQYLFLFSAVAAGLVFLHARWSAARRAAGVSLRITRRESAPTHVAGSPWILLLFAVPSAVALYFEPRIVIGFRHSWHPLPANLLYYAPCFAAGWWLWRRHRAGDVPGRWAGCSLALSVIVFAALLPFLDEHCRTEFTGMPRILLTTSFALFAWLSAIGWFSLFLRVRRKPPRGMAYLAGASFWMYLFHHPVVGLAQVALHGAAVPAGAKFVIVTLAATALSLLTYHVWVRDTWVGVLLHGRRANAAGAAGRAAVIRPHGDETPLHRAA